MTSLPVPDSPIYNSPPDQVILAFDVKVSESDQYASSVAVPEPSTVPPAVEFIVIDPLALTAVVIFVPASIKGTPAAASVNEPVSIHPSALKSAILYSFYVVIAR